MKRVDARPTPSRRGAICVDYSRRATGQSRPPDLTIYNRSGRLCQTTCNAPPHATGWPYQPMGDIQRADPAARRTALILLGCATLAGAALMIGANQLRPRFEAWLEHYGSRVGLTLVGIAIITLGPLLGFAWYLWSLGRRTVRAGRYPPPGLRVTRDTPVLTGQAARRRGRLAYFFAGLLATTALLFPLLLFALRPVCTPISAEDLREFNVPIERRTDRDLYLKVFQKRNQHWYHCKTWISRQLFF